MSSAKANRNNFLVQGGILAIASILVRLIGIVYRIPMVRYIGEEGSGYYGVAFNIYNIALILSSYSLPLAVSKLVAARNVKHEYRNSYRIFTAAMTFAVVVGLVSSSIIYFGAEFFATKLFGMPRVAYPLKVLAPTLFVFAVMGVMRGFYQGKNTMIPTAVSQVLEQIVNAIVSVLGAYLFMKAHDASQDIAAYGAAGGTLGTLMGAITSLLFLLFVFVLNRPTFKKQMRRDHYSKKESYSDIYRLLLITIVPVVLSQTVYQLSGSLDDVIFSRIMLGKGYVEESVSQLLGVYSQKYRLLTNVPIAIASAIAASMIPSIVASCSLGEYHDVKVKIHAAIKTNMIIAFPSALGMAVLAGPIMKLLFGTTSSIANNLLLYGSMAIVFYTLSTISNAVLQGVNMMRIPVRNAAISLGVHIVLLIALLQMNMSVYALVIGNVTFPLLICILNWIDIHKKLHYRQEVVSTFMIPFLSACIMGIFTFLSYQGIFIILKSNTVATIGAILVAMVVYFIALILLRGVTEEELKALPKGRSLIHIAKRFHLM